MKARILVVDDEKSIRYTFECFLSDAGYDVVIACNYDEAMEKLGENDFDLIFADIILGEKTGIDLLRMVREKKMFCPVVMVTGHPNVDTASEAVRLGAFDYLAKPVEKKQILHTAKIALEHKAITEENKKYRSNLEAIFRSVKDGIVTVDKELNVIQFNDAIKNICNFPEDFIGKSFKCIPDGCNSAICLEGLMKTIKEKEPVELNRIECCNNHRQNQVVSINITPLIGSEDEFCGAVMVIKDETHLVEMEKQLYERSQFHNITGKSREMQKIYSVVEKLADIPTTVLITGESGTGKELIAQALHHEGIRRDKPMVMVNCSALPENLLESELFGHVKGAFTGAIKDKIGRFQMAHKGTIFLDEIGDISPALQVRLLRVLQQKEFERVGDGSPIKVDVRIVAATNQNLQEKIKKGDFREDLYYRLKVVEINLPPLRERQEDIPLLVEVFIKKFNKQFNKHIKSVSKDVQKLFMEYSWPGNIRELEHTIEYSFVMSSHPIITMNDLPLGFKDVFHKEPEVNKIEDESLLIKEILEKTGWRKAKAAKSLGISRSTLYRKMEEYKIFQD